MELLDEPISETFAHSSYSLSNLITLAARHNLRDFLGARWKHISRLQMIEFDPESSWETFLYRAEHGRLKSWFPYQTQSWAKLREEALRIDDGDLPKGFKRYPQFLILLWLVYPHRMRTAYVKFLDEILANS
jgi:hypothetical protein